MSNKFKDVPLDKDTSIRDQQVIKIGEYDALHQKWFWDGIKAESLIFANNDVEHLNETEIEQIAMKSSKIDAGSTITIKISESGYTFVNFNFEH